MTIAFFTTTRAEYGLLLPLIKEIKKNSDLSYRLFVGGTHLSEKYGNTKKEILDSGSEISAEFNYVSAGSDPFELVKSLAKETDELSKIFRDFKFDLICILGDRYELLPIVNTAIIFRKAIVHIHGGERSEGVIDEQIRHMITKAAHIHFAACDEYAENIRKLGEENWRVFNTGALFVDNITQLPSVRKGELFRSLSLNEDLKTILLTYHPETHKEISLIQEQIRNILLALKAFDLQIIITSPGNEAGREIVMSEIVETVKENAHYHFFESLGMENYLGILPYCEFVIGNSSSGIIEVPYFKIPTINVGQRQKGRLRHPSVIDTDHKVGHLKKAISRAFSPQFRQSIGKQEYLFGEGNSAKQMVQALETLSERKDILLKKLCFK